MAHKIKIFVTPHTNADGTLSKTKKDYTVIDRARSGRVVVGVFASEKTAQEAADTHRRAVVWQHATKNPRDQAFQEKHDLHVFSI